MKYIFLDIDGVLNAPGDKNLIEGIIEPNKYNLLKSLISKTNSKEMSIFIAMGTFGYALGPAISSGITEIWGLDKLPFACFIGIVFAFMLLKTTRFDR